MIRRLLARSLPGEAQAVALTFDDGPDPRFTPLVLEALATEGVQATFFVVGERAARHPDLVRRILREGHALGSHSHRHPEPRSLGWGIVPDFVRGRRAVERAASQPVRLFRPPKGYAGRKEHVAMAAARVEPWLWTIDVEDWQPGVTADQIVAGAAGVEAGDVLLLHDAICGPLAPEATDRTATVEAVPRLVALVRERGLGFVTLPVAG